MKAINPEVFKNLVKSKTSNVCDKIRTKYPQIIKKKLIRPKTSKVCDQATIQRRHYFPPSSVMDEEAT